MSNSCYVLLPLVVTQLVRVTSDTRNTLFSIMMQDCWGAKEHTASSPVGVSEQRAIHDMKTLESEMTGVSVFDAAYVALGCKWASTVAAVLKSLTTRQVSRSVIRNSLAKLNQVTLKAESVLFQLAEFEPNVLTREPGALATALSLNLRLNRADGVTGSAEVAKCSQTSYQINAAINTIERFTIGNCVMAVQPYSVTDHKNESPDLVATLDDVLDRTRLSEPNYGQYNMNDHAPSDTDPKWSSVVHSVASNFCLLLDLPVDKNLTFVYVDDVFRHQQEMYDRIRWVIHSQTLVYLMDLKNAQKSNQSDPPGDNYLGETYIEQNDLVLYYQNLLNKANSLSFPPDIIDHVQLMLTFVKSIVEIKTVKSLHIYIAYEKRTIAFFSANKSNVSDSSRVLKNYTPSESKHFELHTFLNEILSVEFVKYYNNIFKLSKYGFQEVQYRDVVFDGNSLSYYNLIYKHCFNIKLDNEHSIMEQEILNSKIINILYDLETLKNYICDTHKTVKLTILIEADQYLNYNIIRYSVSDKNVQDKLNRTIYMFTNLIDRHQMIFFERYVLRDDAFITYTGKYNNGNPEILNFGISLKIKEKKHLSVTNIEDRLQHCVLFHDIHKMKLGIRSSVNLFWKGKLKNINDILNDVSTNLFDLYSIPKYVEVFIEWVTAVVSYTLLDLIKYILDGHTIPYLHRFIEEWNNYKWPEYCLVTFKTAINIMSKNSIQKDECVELQSILKNNLHLYSNAVQRDDKYQVSILSPIMFANNTEELSSLLKTLICLDNKITNECKTKSSKNPLVFYLPEYFIKV